ncbi:MAG: hypothetical protein K2K47_05270 [Duncaniella sp.]|nr:hypothetical protein [Duncaniella sp.]
MKKFLLLGVAAVATLGAAAQTQYCFTNVTELKETTGQPLDKSVDVAAGFVILENEYGKLTSMFDEPLGTFTPCGSLNYVSVGGGDLQKIVAGINGNNNPKGQSMTSLPTSGMVFQLYTEKTGYFTILTKMNTNKNYWVFEGSSFAAYRLGDCALSKAEGEVVEYTLPYDEFMGLDLNAADIDKYFTVADDGSVTGPKVPWAVVNPEGSDMGEGSGFMTLCSYATPEFPITYTFFAQGSKMACDGFIFTPCDEPTFADAPEVVFGGVEKVAEDGTVTPAPTPVVFAGKIYNDPAGIENIVVDAAADVNAPMYNVLGQRVNESYKGLVIKNGKKFINK